MTFHGSHAMVMPMKNKIVFFCRQVEATLGHLKFAVLIISLFAICLAYGTFMESYHGTDYANRLVYKSAPFMLLQALMFFSILFATTLRLPYQKRLFGFYILHLGLLIIFIGSLITYIAGIDGNMTLYPNTPQREINLNSDEFKMQITPRNKEYTLELPYRSSPVKMNQSFENLKLLNFTPFAEDEIEWLKNTQTDVQNDRLHSSTYSLYNDNFEESLTLSLNNESDFKTSTQIGLLNVHYMPKSMMKCFSDKIYEGLIFWNAMIGECFLASPKLLKPVKTNPGQKAFSYPIDGQSYIFIPELSPLPLDKNKKIIEDSPYRVFSTRLFEDKPHLFLFGEGLAYFSKDSKKWNSFELKKSSSPAELPWMGFKLLLSEHSSSHFPKLVPHPVVPIQENSKVIKGNIKALHLELNNEKFWLKNSEPIQFKLNNEEWTLSLGQKTIKLPFEIILNEFKMDTDPGTKNPASYESFVTLFKGNAGSSKHHVYMNHPMKEGDFTFYQASYFEVQPGVMGSVFSVNYDPGRFWKYLGSILLVFGSIWHFVIRRKKDKSHV